MDFHIFSDIILRYIHQSFRNHHRNPVLRITEPLDQQFCHIEAFSKDLMTECKACCNFAHHRYLIVFNNFICHNVVLLPCRAPVSESLPAVQTVNRLCFFQRSRICSSVPCIVLYKVMYRHSHLEPESAKIKKIILTPCNLAKMW